VTETIVETMLARTITVVPQIRGAKHLTVRDTDQSKEVRAYLYKDDAEKLGLALIGDNATVITDLPEATSSKANWDVRNVVRSGRVSFYADVDPEKVLQDAKDGLAVYKLLVEQQAVTAKEAEVAKAKEAELTKRRDELATEFRGYVSTYRGSTSAFSGAIDRIIELEEAAK